MFFFTKRYRMVANFCVFHKSRAIHENYNLEIFAIHVQVNREPCFNLSYMYLELSI